MQRVRHDGVSPNDKAITEQSLTMGVPRVMPCAPLTRRSGSMMLIDSRGVDESSGQY
jgi:hypothetical protein